MFVRSFGWKSASAALLTAIVSIAPAYAQDAPPPGAAPGPPPGAAAPPSGAKEETGTLVLTSEPAGATVIVDGEEKGQTPAEIKGLSAGPHDVLVKMAGHKDWRKTLAVKAAFRTRYTAKLEEGKSGDSAKTAAKKDGKTKEGAKDDWKKGTIYEGRPSISPGSIINPNNNVGITFGPFFLKDRLFINITPHTDIHWSERFSTGFQIPLNLKIVDLSRPVDSEEVGALREEVGRLRKEDYDESNDYAKLIRYIKYGNKADKTYFQIGNLTSYTIGHGTVVKRYVSGADFDHKKLGLQFDMAFQKDQRNDYGGFEFFLSDITFKSRLLGLLAYAKPLVGMDDEIAQSLSVGVHFTTDQNAPVTIQRDDFGKPLLDESSDLLFDPGKIYAVGLDGVVKVVRTASADIKPYFDFSYFSGGGDSYEGRAGANKGAPVEVSAKGMGVTLGVLNRFVLGEERDSRPNVRAELRLFNQGFLPGYFNTFYEIQKFQFFNKTNLQTTPTKLEFLASASDGFRAGYNLELGYDYSSWFSFGVGLDGSTGDEGRNFLMRLGLNPGFISAHATYHKVNWRSGDSLTDFDADNHIFMSVIRLKILPILFIRTSYQRTWLVENREFDERRGLYRQISAAELGIEVGYDF